MDKALAAQMKEWRQYLHQYPESSLEEKDTAAFIADKLREMGYEPQTGIGGTGVVASLTVGDGKEAIALRADIDALDLDEQGDVPYKSKVAGKMHGCGHDGHIATLLGAAKLLMDCKNFNGTAVFIFQPAEEPGKGAVAMMKDGLFERFPVDEIYGMHNAPHLPLGTISTRKSGISACEDNFVIKIKGKGSHASTPHMGVDPLVIAAEIILALQTITSRSKSPMQPAVISCTELITDGARNSIPATVTIKGDTRSTTPEMQHLVETRMRALCEGACRMNGAECEFTYTHEFAPTVNWDQCVDTAVKAAIKTVGADKVDANCEPLMTSEDFGAYMQKIPGCYLLLGSARHENVTDNIPLHNPLYDFNDDILETGAAFFAQIISTRLPE